MRGKMQVYTKAKITQKMQMYRQLAIDRQERIDELEAELEKAKQLIKQAVLLELSEK